MTRARGLTVGALALAAGCVGVFAAVNAGNDPGPSNEPAEWVERTRSSLDTVTVVRRTLEESEEIDGEVGHGAHVPLPIEAQGTVTDAPEQDDVLNPGDVAVRVDNRPVTLVEGAVPLYRELRRVPSNERDAAGDKVGEQTGVDVVQLQTYLLSQGFDDEGRLEVDGVFGSVTENAVEDWQESVGHPSTGRVDRSQIIFVRTSVRVEEAPLVGQPFTPIIVTTPSRMVTATATSAQRTQFLVGTAVDVDVDGTSLAGTITAAQRETTVDGSTRYELEIEVNGDLPEVASSVDVTATRTIAEDVSTVPVRALLALAEGGWAVEVPNGAGTELVRVELGSIVEGIAEISGVDDGTTVLVPA